MNRLTWIDAAKGIGIVLVVWGHVWRGLGSAGLIPVDDQTYYAVDTCVYLFHMPLFFFLAGLFFESSIERKGVVPYLANRVDNLVFPYVIWSYIQGSVLCALSRYTNRPLSWSDVGTSIFIPISQFWFLYALFIICVAASLLWKLLGRRSAWSVLFLGLLLDNLFDGPDYPEVVGQIVWNSIFFAAGDLAARARSPIQWRLPLWASLLFAILLIAGEAAYLHAGFDYRSGPLIERLALAFLGIGTVIGLAQLSVECGASVIVFLGLQSLPIYLLHVLCGSGARIVLHKILHVSNLPLHLVVGLAAGIALPLILERVAQRWNLLFVFKLPPRWALETRVTKVQDKTCLGVPRSAAQRRGSPFLDSSRPATTDQTSTIA